MMPSSQPMSQGLSLDAMPLDLWEPASERLNAPPRDSGRPEGLEVLDDHAPPREDALTRARRAMRRRGRPASDMPEPVDLVRSRPEPQAEPELDEPVDLMPQREEAPAQTRRTERYRPLARFAAPEDAPSFYLSLSDLMSLLLVFFVLIFSLTESGAPVQAQPAPVMSVTQEAPSGPINLAPAEAGLPDPQPLPAGDTLRIVAVAGQGQSDPGLVGEPARQPEMIGDGPSLAGAAAGPRASGPVIDRTLLTLVSTGAALPDMALPSGEPTLDELLRRVREQNIPGLQMEADAGKLVIRLPEAITFDSASAVVKPGMDGALGKLAQVLRSKSGAVLVTGHTDDQPIHNVQFASNWELSASRAAAVARALIAHGLDRRRVTIRGLADREPIAPNDSPAHRAANRRVEIELQGNAAG